MMKIISWTLWKTVRFGLAVGLLTAVLVALPHLPTGHDALIFCGGSVVGAFLGSLLYAKLGWPDRSAGR